MYFLGYDVGSSSVKASLINGETGECVASDFFPKQEMKITANKAGWAEQHPDLWWENLKLANKSVLATSGVDPKNIEAIGISYQMHGLVVVDKDKNVLRPSIIWCDSRAAEIGDKAFDSLGGQRCLSSLLNSPGNFTASKLKWVKDNEPEVFAKIDKIMLPGDYIAMKLTGQATTTVSGLSEGMFWDFQNNALSKMVMEHYGFSEDVIPEIRPTFSDQGQVTQAIAQELGLAAGTKISYRGGDQPNNALSLNVLNPGEVATTAGTSGVVYGVSDEIKYDEFSRVNTFAHVNHSDQQNRLGVLLCINGTGILNSWMNKNVGNQAYDYVQMNELAAKVPIGAEGVSILPFGNGAERVLRNKNIGSQISGISFNSHSQAHMFRAAQEGIVFSFNYGMEIMKQIGIDAKVIRAGKANMFLSPIFRETLAGISGATIELYNTDGSVGAARGAAVGSGYYKSFTEAFGSLKKLLTIEPDTTKKAQYEEAYGNWKQLLERFI
ncbi:MAG: carbohydrate kinase [Prolixibacteraceae bacterium]|nr:carbohydrate kinase [Prolixibacteraceae bacterium]MBN2649629.1 carbohydrate kinase [Prolixibacteraceae bacterium]